MLTNNTQQLFESVARAHPQLREWLRVEYERNIKLLVHVTDSEQMRRLQGHAQCLSGLVEHLDQALAPKARTVPPTRNLVGSST